jgi:hypothetical protein
LDFDEVAHPEIQALTWSVDTSRISKIRSTISKAAIDR